MVGADVVGYGGNAVAACKPTFTKARFDSLASIVPIGTFRAVELKLLYAAPATAPRSFVGLGNVDIKKRGLAAFFVIRLWL